MFVLMYAADGERLHALSSHRLRNDASVAMLDAANDHGRQLGHRVTLESATAYSCEDCADVWGVDEVQGAGTGLVNLPSEY